MLEIKDICKQYKTGNLVQKALDHVSLNLRENEFVAILGPSGSGKTTLLNIIGGLDRYDSGDLIINGVSTKKYKDRDWDSYRNHTIGFVFQSYNLIPHQTVLANVELALTISGISGSERKKRAIEALEKVGLKEQIHKKPNQMSGGQMQRVALARALVNDPDILLADEPTGALDSETSIQVMDLLKEVAKDRLVVMVTHNPELAHQYANRIVTVKDGHILSDTNPYLPESVQIEPVHKNFGKSSMSFFTALMLSLNNLMTKKARTILVSFAGSIGIIGIALILSLSNGVNVYIKNTEQETLSEYPLEIAKSSFSMSSMMTSMSKPQNDTKKDGEVKEVDIVGDMFGGISTNDLASLKKYIDSGKTNIAEYSRSIEYQYNVEPQIYLPDTDNGIKKVNPNTLLASSGLAPTSSAYASSFSMNDFFSLPKNKDLYEDSYDVKEGRWPQSYNEAVVVLSQNGTVSDMVLYSLGLKDYRELEKIVESFQNSENADVSSSSRNYSYKDFVGLTLKLVNACDTYTYDDTMQVYSSKENDTAYMKNLIQNGEDLKIVGVVQPKDGENVTMLSQGIYYSSSLVEHVINQAKNSEIVQAQLSEKDKNIFTGKRFGDEENSFDPNSLFTIDQNALQDAFKMDTSKINIDFAKYFDTSSLQNSVSLSDDTLKNMVSSSLKQVSQEDAQKAFQNIFESYLKYLEENNLANPIDSFEKYLQSGEAKQILVHSFTSIVKNETNTKLVSDAISKALAEFYQQNAEHLSEYLNSDDGKQAVYETIQNAYRSVNLVITDDDLNSIVQNLVQGYVASGGSLDVNAISSSFTAYLNTADGQAALAKLVDVFIDTDHFSQSFTNAMNEQSSTLIQVLTNSINQAMTAMAQQIPKALSIDTSAFANAFQFNMSADDLQNVMTSMLNSSSATYEGNLSTLGFADLSDPNEIVIYPKDFDAKTKIKDLLEDYNTQMKKVDEDKVITYTDVVGTLMTSVTDIVNVISYVLIAFVAISLVVSSIMIGVITYISVLERQKEIGILRAIGASKRNISNVFNAETFITGALAGLFGVGITLILLVPGNALIHTLTNSTDVNATLPMQAGFVLIALSIILTLIGGIIPSKKAAKSDPVKALRTD